MWVPWLNGLFGDVFSFCFHHSIFWFFSDELWKLKTHFRCFQFPKLSFHGIFVIKHTCMGPIVSAKSHQHTFWYYLQWLSSSMGTRSLLHLYTTIFFFFFFFFFFSFFFFWGKLYHYLHTTTNRSLDPPSSFFLGKLYHHRSELRPTIFSLLPDSTVGTIISVLDPLISKIKK